MPTITLGGNLTARGGGSAGSGTPGAGAAIDLKEPACSRAPISSISRRRRRQASGGDIDFQEDRLVGRGQGADDLDGAGTIFDDAIGGQPRAT